MDGSIMLEVNFCGWCYIPENCKVERNNAESSTFVEDRAVRLMYRSMVELERPQMTILCGACSLHYWITREEYRHTLVIFSTYCFFTAQMVTRTRLSVKSSPHLRTMSTDSPPRDRIRCTVSTATWRVQSNKPRRGENLKLQCLRRMYLGKATMWEEVWKRRFVQR